MENDSLFGRSAGEKAGQKLDLLKFGGFERRQRCMLFPAEDDGIGWTVDDVLKLYDER